MAATTPSNRLRYVDHTYRDFSHYIEEGGELVKHKKSTNNFPARLHRMLENEEHSGETVQRTAFTRSPRPRSRSLPLFFSLPPDVITWMVSSPTKETRGFPALHRLLRSLTRNTRLSYTATRSILEGTRQATIHRGSRASILCLQEIRIIHETVSCSAFLAPHHRNYSFSTFHLYYGTGLMAGASSVFTRAGQVSSIAPSEDKAERPRTS